MNKIRANTIRFHSGLLLSREILEEMTVQSRLFLLQYDTYPDGILSGLEWLEEEGKLYLTAGMLKYQGIYYFLSERICVTEVLDHFDRTMQGDIPYTVLALVLIQEETRAEGIETRTLELQLLPVKKLQKEDIILAEFQYFKGKRNWLPEQMTPDEMLENQINSQASSYSFLNVNYSLPHEQVFSPRIYRIMQKCLTEKKKKSPEDTQLLFMLSQHELLSMEVLRQWFLSYGKKPDMSNRKDIIQNFLSCVHTQFVLSLPQEPEEPEEVDDFGI